MKNMWILCLLVCLSCKDTSEPKNEIASETANNIEVSDVELEVFDYDGLENFLSSKTEKIYVVNFWATWCKPCIKELPYFEAINETYDDVEVILVSLDFPSKYESQLKPYIVEHQLKSQVVALNDVDANTWIPKVDKDWTGAIPATVIFSQNKRQFYERSFNYDELESEIKQFLK